VIRDGGFSIYEYTLEDDILSGEGVPFCHCKERSDFALSVIARSEATKQSIFLSF